MDKDQEKLDLAYVYLKNAQNMAAHDLFILLAQKEAKNQSIKAGLYYLLASQCKTKQGKDVKEDLLDAAKFYLEIAKDPSKSHYAYQCAARCFLKIGQYEDAMKASEEAKKHIPKFTVGNRPIVVVDDSPAIILRIKNFLQQLGYDDIQTVNDGKSAISLVNKLVKASQNPIILLDMDLPDITGDVVGKKLLHSKPDLSIILITADEKATPRVKKSIGFGSAAFVQKPFTINELKNALDTAKTI